MLGAAFQFVDQFFQVEKAAEDADFRNLGHAAATIRKDAVASIVPAAGPSQPGTPPHTRARVTKKGKQLKGQIQRALAFDADKTSAVIGPKYSVIGTSGEAHEFGGEYRGEEYPERSFMGPALEQNTSRFGESYAGSIGG